MVINALNCGASTFMADLEDANCPTWHNMLDGQVNLRDAVRRTISLAQNGKQYRLNDKTAVLIPRPRGSGPYFYLPKMESHLEARLWNDVFVFSQDELKISRGSIKATALIETVVAAFEMDEILYELREVTDGCDGTWVAHPGLVSVAKQVFDQHMPAPNQYARQRPDVNVTAQDLLNFQPEKPITEAGIRNNISSASSTWAPGWPATAACRCST